MRVEERYLHVQVETGLAWSEEVTWNGLYDGGNKEDYAEGHQGRRERQEILCDVQWKQ